VAVNPGGRIVPRKIIVQGDARSLAEWASAAHRAYPRVTVEREPGPGYGSIAVEFSDGTFAWQDAHGSHVADADLTRAQASRTSFAFHAVLDRIRRFELGVENPRRRRTR
jgi:hypothetical protein